MGSTIVRQAVAIGGDCAGICDGYTYEGIKEKWPETYAARKADKLNFRYPAGESYMDVVKRLESVIIEVERENESVCIVGHQAILRCVYAYFMHVPREDVRSLPPLSASALLLACLYAYGRPDAVAWLLERWLLESEACIETRS